jgi:hypothetical protein
MPFHPAKISHATFDDVKCYSKAVGFFEAVHPINAKGKADGAI